MSSIVKSVSFDPAEVAKKKFIKDYDALRSKVFAHRILGERIVVTIGSWDILHVGHVRYLWKARGFGTKLVVGVDSDRAIKLYKGPTRPIIPEHERCEMVFSQECVDYVTLIDDVDGKGKWLYGLIEALAPDVFVAVEDSYPSEQLDDIRRHVLNLVVLPRQAVETSSTNIIQNIVKGEVMAKEIHKKEKKRLASKRK
jgi:D-glycero-beta-D-manno-heptose 1-phosphate adenylyltransferase